MTAHIARIKYSASDVEVALLLVKSENGSRHTPRFVPISADSNKAESIKYLSERNLS